MGACIGKKNSKYLNRKRSQSDIIQTPQPKIQNDAKENKSSPSPSKFLQKLPVTDGSQVNEDDECRTSKLEEGSIDSELQILLDKQIIINETLSKPFPSRIVSFTDTELEYELAILISEPPENNQVENSLTVPCNGTK